MLHADFRPTLATERRSAAYESSQLCGAQSCRAQGGNFCRLNPRLIWPPEAARSPNQTKRPRQQCCRGLSSCCESADQTVARRRRYQASIAPKPASRPGKPAPTTGPGTAAAPESVASPPSRKAIDPPPPGMVSCRTKSMV